MPPELPLPVLAEVSASLALSDAVAVVSLALALVVGVGASVLPVPWVTVVIAVLPAVAVASPLPSSPQPLTSAAAHTAIRVAARLVSLCIRGNLRRILHHRGRDVALGNTGDIITLLDQAGLKIDGAAYSKRQVPAEGRTLIFGA